MFITGRRAKWLILGWLLLLAALLVRPVRSWIDRVVFARAIHPNLQFDELHWHRSSLREGVLLFHAKQLDWGGIQGDRCVGLASDNAWFTLESKPLLTRQFSIPRAIIPGARLTLVSAPESVDFFSASLQCNQPATVESLWQKSLETVSDQQIWQTSLSRIDQLLQIDDLLRQCDVRIQRWMSESESLLSHAEQLAASNDLRINALRNQMEDGRRSESISLLLTQEQRLDQELAAMESELMDKFQQVRSLLDQISSQLHGDNGQPHLDRQDVIDRESREIGRRLVEATAAQAFAYAQPFVEVTDLLYRTALDSPREIYDRDYRPPGLDLLLVDRLTANGIFQSESVRSLFEMEMKCQLTQQDHSLPVSTGQLRLTFPTPRHKIDVTLSHQTQTQRESIYNLQCTLASSRWLKGAAFLEADTADQNIAIINRPQLSINSDGSNLSGTLILDQHLLEFMSELVPELYESMIHLHGQHLFSSDFQPLRLKLQGSWNQFSCEWQSDEIPDWLLSPIKAMQLRHIDRDQREQLAFLDSHIQERLDSLDHQIHELLDQTGMQVAQTRRSMLAVRSQLQQQQENARKVEFARSEQDEVKR